MFSLRSSGGLSGGDQRSSQLKAQGAKTQKQPGNNSKDWKITRASEQILNRKWYNSHKDEKKSFFEDISLHIYYTIWNFENKLKQRNEALWARQKLIKKCSIAPELQNMKITYMTLFAGPNTSCLYKWPSRRSALSCLPLGSYTLTLSCSLSPLPPICGYLQVTEMPVCVTATLAASRALTLVKLQRWRHPCWSSAAPREPTNYGCNQTLHFFSSVSLANCGLQCCLLACLFCIPQTTTLNL